MPLTELEKAYLAGIVDGEGSIMLARSHARSSSAYIYPQVKIANTDMKLIDWINEKVGAGSIGYRSRLNINCKDVYHWGVASNQAYDLLCQIRPYLLIKAHQADVVIALWEENKAAVKKIGRKCFGHGHPIPQWLHNWREASYLYIKDLNRRGLAGPKYGDQVLCLLQNVESG